MKNIHLLPTDKPSRLHKYDFDGFALSKEALNWKEVKKIYITSDEEIKEGDWVLYTKGNKIHYQKLENKNDVELANIEDSGAFKIILTTDQDLIKDGVQAIDDEFLEWFIKNPSCEEVDVVKGFDDGTSYGYNFLDYKIIIPKEEAKPHSFCETPEEKCTMNYCDENGCQNRKRELVEPKQETLEQVAKNTTKKYVNEREKQTAYLEFIEGAKWQQEKDLSMVQGYLSANLQNIELLKRSYSEEEVENIIMKLMSEVHNGVVGNFGNEKPNIKLNKSND